MNFSRRPRRPRRAPSGQGRTPLPAGRGPQHGSAGLPVRQPPPPITPEIAAAVEASAFAPLGLVAPLLRALAEEGYTVPTPVQARVIRPALEGRDVIACAQTGTGKTAGFVLPILQRLAAETPASPGVRALVLTPTRELAAQIGERVSVYGRHLGLRHAVIFGGVGQQPQEVALRHAPDVLIATPGRLLDLMGQGVARLGGVRYFVLDEADRMLDMGFVHDVRRVVSALPRVRQTLFFSATMPPAVEGLATSMLAADPARVSVAPAVTTAESVEQSVMYVDKADKRALLERLLREPEVERAIVFTRTKHGAERLARQLDASGVGAAALHGNKSQGARERALEGFRAGTTRVLVATDIASRGIDVEGISHVFNFELPNVAESYVHRIGRAGRAGATGKAVAFCDAEERGLLVDIERFIRKRLPVAGGTPPPEPVRRAPPPRHEPRQAPRQGAPPPRQAQGGPVRQAASPQAASPSGASAAGPRRRPRHFGPR